MMKYESIVLRWAIFCKINWLWDKRNWL